MNTASTSGIYINDQKLECGAIFCKMYDKNLFNKPAFAKKPFQMFVCY